MASVVASAQHGGAGNPAASLYIPGAVKARTNGRRCCARTPLFSQQWRRAKEGSPLMFYSPPARTPAWRRNAAAAQQQRQRYNVKPTNTPPGQRHAVLRQREVWAAG